MKIKKFENYKVEGVNLNIEVSLFPSGDEYNKLKNGVWTIFINSTLIGKEVNQKASNIIWFKYFNKKDPCEKSSFGPCRPEFDSYPQHLVDTLEYFKNEKNTIKFIKLKHKKYWRFSKLKEPIDKEEIEMTLRFDSDYDTLYWLDLFELVLNNINNYNLKDLVENKRKEIELLKISDKYNL